MARKKNEKFFKTGRATKSSITSLTFIDTTHLQGCKSTSILDVYCEVEPNTNNIIKVISEKEIDHKESIVNFPLKEVSMEEIKRIRKSKVPSFILKKNGKFYYAKLIRDVTLGNCKILGKHQCSYGETACKHFSAKSDKEGGCKKVRDEKSKIENYPWITEGYQTWGTKHNVFVVTKCEHHVSESLKAEPEIVLPKIVPYPPQSQIAAIVSSNI